jgi:hypothetical protein
MEYEPQSVQEDFREIVGTDLAVEVRTKTAGVVDEKLRQFVLPDHRAVIKQDITPHAVLLFIADTREADHSLRVVSSSHLNVWGGHTLTFFSAAAARA